VFDSNAITPGTRFMTLLANQLRAGLEAAVTQPGAFQGLKVRPYPPFPSFPPLQFDARPLLYTPLPTCVLFCRVNVFPSLQSVSRLPPFAS
jgi:hypothetical protein